VRTILSTLHQRVLINKQTNECNPHCNLDNRLWISFTQRPFRISTDVFSVSIMANLSVPCALFRIIIVISVRSHRRPVSFCVIFCSRLPKPAHFRYTRTLTFYSTRPPPPESPYRWHPTEWETWSPAACRPKFVVAPPSCSRWIRRWRHTFRHGQCIFVIDVIPDADESRSCTST
jgi:hypothetical protein